MTARVCIAGTAALSAFGVGTRGLGRALRDGAALPGVPAETPLANPKARKMMAPAAYLAARCLADLLATVGWNKARERVGMYLGVGASAGSLADFTALLEESLVDGAYSLERFGLRGLAACNPLLAFQLMNNFTLCHGAILEGLGGPNSAVFSRGAGTVAAIAEAVHAVRSGDCERAICGGSDAPTHPATIEELARDGFVTRGLAPADGAALIALEREGGTTVIEGCGVASGRGRVFAEALDEAVVAALACGSDRAIAEATDGAAVSVDGERAHGEKNLAGGRAERPVARGDGRVLGDRVRSERAMASIAGVDLVVIAPWGPPAADALRSWVATRCPTAMVVSTAALGESLAGSAALALVAAADLLADDGYRRALVVSLGTDEDPGVILVSRAGANDPAQHAVPSPSMAGVTSTAPAVTRGTVVAGAAARRAVVTGVGAVSAFGVGIEALWAGLAEGRSGVSRIRSFDASTFPTHVAGEVPVAKIDAAWLGEAIGDSAYARELGDAGVWRDRKVAFGLLAAQEAWRMAGCGEAERTASLVIALGLEQAFLEDLVPIFDRDASGKRALAWERADRAPGVRFRAPVDLTARVVHARLDLRGPSVVNASACAAATLAVAHAASLIERGAADVVLCGGADSMVNPLGLGGMCRLGAPSPRDEIDACRPFDRRRDGLVIGEGAAMFVVESAAHAAARGARPLAEIRGWGSTQDGYRTTAPRPDGAAARTAMERALARSGLAPDAIGYVNAHGTGTPLNDPAECLALHGALGAHAGRVPVSSIKGAVGHLMAAAGAIELAASLLAFERDLLPGTANFAEHDPECSVDVIGPRPRAARVDALLSNSFGFGGQNASIVLGRPA